MKNLLRCNRDSCLLGKVCVYDDSICKVKRDYLSGVWGTLSNLFDLSDPELELQMRYHLFPLYTALLSSYMEVYAYLSGVRSKYPSNAIKNLGITLGTIDSVLGELIKGGRSSGSGGKLGYYERLLLESKEIQRDVERDIRRGIKLRKVSQA